MGLRWLRFSIVGTLPQEEFPLLSAIKSKKRSTGERGILPALITGAVGSTHPVAPNQNRSYNLLLKMDMRINTFICHIFGGVQRRTGELLKQRLMALFNCFFYVDGRVRFLNPDFLIK